MHHKKRLPGLRRRGLAAGVAVCLSGLAVAQEQTLDTVTVSATRNQDADLGKPDNSSPATVYKVEREGMALFDTPGGTNPLTAVAEVPGIKVSTLDAYGLANIQGGQKGLRVRGEVNSHGVVGTTEGLSLGGPGPGPGGTFLFDKENVERVEMAQGPVSADRGSLFNTSGVLNTRLRWAADKAGGEFTLSAGTENFRRLFVRADSGELASGTAFFASASSTAANKWRGEGDSPNARENFEGGFRQRLGDLQVSLFYARNDMSQHSYKTLNAAQAADLAQYRGYDYSSAPGTSDYYDFNRQDFLNQAAIAEIVYAFSPDTRLTVRPYYAREEGYYLYANNAQVFKWLFDHETYGLSSELATRLGDTGLKFGYSWTSAEPPGPPTTRKSYTVSGNQLVFAGWNLLSKVVDPHEFENYYVTGEHRFGALNLSGSLRYVSQKLAGIDAYNTAGTNNASWDISAEDALSRATRNASRSVSSRTLTKLLPQFGLSYTLSPAVELRANIGQTYGAPSIDVFNTAPSGSVTSSQQYWDRIKPEIATGIDLGARVSWSDGYFEPTFYYSRSRNKAFAVFDPASNAPVSQNVGSTQAMGLQLASGWTASNRLQLLSGLSYSRSVFTDNPQTAASTTLYVDGRQLPDVPKLMANLGAVWRHEGFSVAPMAQYVGPRWATSNYDYRVPGYWLADLTLGYSQKTSYGKWNVNVGVMNLFDRRYIGQVSTSEITGNTNIYYPGAPRTVYASIGASF